MSDGLDQPRLLEKRMVEKPWGRDTLPAPFSGASDQRIGEIWFEPPPELGQLLVKYLFTSEKLSVQVHPSNDSANEGEAGKEECWLVLDAEPDARLAIGFDQRLSPEQMASAARDGSIEELLTWHPAKAGDVFYLPAGTVHAIGAGLSLVEIQQNSDTTFRLFDYGRPRDLHLERATDVAKPEPYHASNQTSVSCAAPTLVDREFFRLDRIEGCPDPEVKQEYLQPMLALPLSGTLQCKGAGEQQIFAEAGECLFASNISDVDFSDAGVTLLIRPS